MSATLALDVPDHDLELLCLGAHPDDIEIGCGGTLLELAGRRALRATFATLTGTPERRAEARAAAEAFVPGARVHAEDLPDGRLPARWGDAKAALERLAAHVRPDLVLCPRRDDAHQDHRTVAELVTTVWRDALVWEYEIPKWDGDMAGATHYVPVSPENARRKVELLTKSYPSQVGRDWWDDETFTSLMRLRGVECRARYAEAFVVRKAVLAP
ncbi:PIG-L deacetylase family protein [Isoptericola sp. BMS4]|uniref:PIG-L deacetylase family protein n=1 Tax=Isoptericola sp. BMS4 TaxID=2527875 RepID=UPI0014238703|nr:PIG-L family deacetylase [Isoptericola sp. BMS4]